MRWAGGEPGSNRQCEPHSFMLVVRYLSYPILGSELTPWMDFSGMNYSSTLHRYTSFDMSLQNKYNILVV